MLKDRIQITDTGFRVMRGPDENTEVFYGEFSLRMRPEERGAAVPTRYWSAMDTFEQKIDRQRVYICVEEKKNGEVTDRHCFYFSGGCPKSLLSITDRPARKYGKGARLITIRWPDGSPEPISSRYIYLEGRKGERFYFLRDFIEPLDADSKTPQDQYVYLVPEDEDGEAYTVRTDPVLREKYTITTV